MRRRWVIVVLCVLAGGVVNVLVAWGVLWRAGLMDPTADFFGPDAAAKGWPWPVHPPWPPPEAVVVLGNASARFVHASSTDSRYDRSFPIYQMVVVRAGWPLWSVAAVSMYHPGSPWQRGLRTDGIIEFLSWRQGLHYHDRSGLSVLLPTMPHWPGFAVGTLFYGAALWLPPAGFFELRRRRRRRSGLCLPCAYDLRGVTGVCPECGRGHQHGGATA